MKLVKEEIFSYSKGENLFVAGERLSEQDSIGYINHIEAENRFTTVVVENGEEYFVDVNLKKLERSTCDCKNYEKNNRCIHILALMFRVVELTKEVEIEESATETLITTNFLNYFGLNTNSYPVLRLYPKIFINEKTNIYNVEFAIGEAGERPYIVKNLGEVLHALLNRKSIELGKKFVFETNEYKLDAFSTKVLNLISGHEAINMYRRTLRRFTALEFDKMQMTKFLDDLRETSFELNFKEIEITSTPLPIDLHVKYEEHEIIFELNEQVEVEHIIKNCFLKIEDKYYFLDDNQIEIYRLFDPLLQGEVNITINSKYFENVVVDIMEKVKKVFNISAADVFFQKPIEAELVIEVYMETTLDNEFKITPVFKYEDVEYGFDGVKVNDDHTKLVTRDTFMEKRVKQILQRLGLQETATGDEFGYFLTKNVNQRFEILTEVIPELAEFSQLFIDEKIKRRLRKSSDNQIAFSMKKGNDLNFFEIDFNIEGLTQKEISEILESYHQKNQFHELKNGELFVFDDEEVMKQLDFIDQMPSLFSYDDHRVPIYHLLAVDQLARSLFTNIDVDQEIENFVEKALNPQDISNKISINANMREYQEYGVSWLNNLYQAGLGGILCDEMGLGKTIQILGFLTTLDADFKALIVVPKALIYNWIAEIQKFAPGLTYQQIEGSKEERTIAIEQVNNYNISITSYNMARIDEQAYEDIEFDFVILDEAQYIKNFSTKVSKSIKKLKSRQKFALTGTPIENNLLELWSIIDFAMPNYLGTRQKFTSTYVNRRTNDKFLKYQLNSFILRRLKKDVLTELPDKIETPIYCEMTQKQKALYVKYVSMFEQEVSEMFDQNQAINQVKVLTLLTRLRQIASHPQVFLEDYDGGSGKIELLMELINENIEQDKKILVFSQFTSLLKIVQKELEELDCPHYYLDGKTNSKDRIKFVEQFNNDQTPVFLISLKAGGVGINLTSASTVIHLDPWWNPSVERQATDRAHRIGQKNVVQVDKLIAKGTIEEKIFELQQQKQKLMDDVLDLDAKMLKDMSKTEILDLFSFDLKI